MQLELIVGKCLAKNPAERYQHIDDLIVDVSTLRKKLESGVTATAGSGTRSGLAPVVPASALNRTAIRKAALFAVVGAAAVALSVIGARTFRHSPETVAPRTVKFAFTPAQLLRGGNTEIDAEVSISGDGKHIAYVESQGGQLWVRDIDQEQAHPVPGATRVYQAFWSPDNQYIGYSAGQFCAGCDLVRIPAQGGTPLLITKIEGAFRRASWSSDGETIVYCDTTGMYTVPTRGGSPTLIVRHPHIEHPSFLDLPGGRRAFLYAAVEPGQPGHGIYVQVVGEDRRRLITLSSSGNPYPAYSPSGHIIYVDGMGDSTAIWALPFSLAKLQASGTAFPIVQHGASQMVSRTGTLVYSDVPSNRFQLTWVDRSGKAFPQSGNLYDRKAWHCPRTAAGWRSRAGTAALTFGYTIWSGKSKPGSPMMRPRRRSAPGPLRETRFRMPPTATEPTTSFRNHPAGMAKRSCWWAPRWMNWVRIGLLIGDS
jgi:hypothetical protein